MLLLFLAKREREREKERKDMQFRLEQVEQRSDYRCVLVGFINAIASLDYFSKALTCVLRAHSHICTKSY